MELLQAISHVSGNDHGFHEGVSSIHKDVWDVFEILVSGGEMDNFTVSEYHLISSQLSPGHVMGIDLFQVETFLGLKILCELDLFLGDLAIFLLLVNGSDIETTANLWEASSFLSCNRDARRSSG